MGTRTKLDVPAILVGAVILTVEAIVLLVIISDGRHRILGGDGPEYVRYARNLVDHGSFSLASAQPFDPSVYRTPGYPLFLATIRLIGGDSLVLVRVVQLLLFGLTAAGVYAIAAQLADRTTARVAGLLSVTYLPFLWFTRFHLSETVSTLLTVGVILLLLEVRARKGRHQTGALIALGLLIGVTAEVRPNFGFVVLAVAGVLALGPPERGRERVRAIAVMGAAFLIAILPWTVRNLSESDRLVPFGAAGGISLYMSASQYQGTVTYKATEADFRRVYATADQLRARAQQEDRSQRSDVPLSVRTELDTNHLLTQRARDVFNSLSVGHVLRSIPKRLAYLWSTADAPPPHQAFTFFHRLGQLQYAAYVLLFAVGLWVLARSRRRRAALMPLLLFAAYVTAIHLVFHIESRYSVPARGPLLVICAIGAVDGARWLRDRPRNVNRPMVRTRA